MEDDPFSCFGSDEENEQNATGRDSYGIPAPTYQLPMRDESCGVLTFHTNTEFALLMHVRNELSSGLLHGHNESDNSNVPQYTYTKVLSAIDNFCKMKHWMMHIGPEKGSIIKDALQETIHNHLHTTKTFHSSSLGSNSEDDSRGTRHLFTCVELGSYCGYSSILLGGVFRQQNKQIYENIDFHIYTVEINPVFANIAREIIHLACLDDIITVVENELMFDGSTSDVSKLLQNNMLDTGRSNIDFLLIDHDKDSYLSDLMKLEKSGLLKKGATVAADNVIFACINDYLGYMKGMHNKGIIHTQTISARVEYCDQDIRGDEATESCYRDGIELSRYLVDPTDSFPL